MNYTDRFLNHVLTNHSSLSQLITSYLVAKYPTVKINGIVRNPSKVPANFSAKSNITIFEANSSDKAAVTKALKGSQVCICGYLGDKSLMTEGQKLLIDACIEAGVHRYIASDWTSDYRTVELGEVPMKDPMKIIYAYLQVKQATGSATRGVHILNGGFTEMLLANVFADDAHTKVHYFGSGDVGIAITTVPNVAAWTAEIAMDPSADGVINVNGGRVSHKDIAKLLGEAYETEITLQTNGSIEDLKNIIDGMRNREPDNMQSWGPLLYFQWVLSGKGDLTSVDNARYPMVKPTTLADYLKQHIIEDVDQGY